MKKQTVINIVLFLLSAVIYGEIEATHVQFGPATLGVFIANYHVPMAILMLLLAYAFKTWVHVPLWVLFEDMTFWIFSGHELSQSSWVSMGLGGLTTHMGYLPLTYALILVSWIVLCAYQYVRYRRSRRL